LVLKKNQSLAGRQTRIIIRASGHLRLRTTNQKPRLDFAGHQFVLLCAVFALALTLTEAKSPRMWDTPFLFMVGNAIVTGVYLL
jgi:hypothetical protein